MNHKMCLQVFREKMEKVFHFVSCFKSLRRSRGFTLVEMLMAAFIFSLIIVSASGIFIYSVRSQKVSLSSQELLSQTSYAIEYMSRMIRMARKDVAGDCIVGHDNYSPTDGVATNITFIRYDSASQEERCHRFLLEDNQIKEQKCLSASACFAVVPKVAVTSPRVKVNNLQFKVKGGSQPPADEYQPRVTIFLDAEGVGVGSDNSPKIKIQTTVSQRDIDIGVD